MPTRRLSFCFGLIAVAVAATSAFAAGHEIGAPAFGPPGYVIGPAAFASNDNGFLAVWRVDMLGGGRHIDGAVVDAAGRRLSPTSFRIIAFSDAVDPYAGYFSNRSLQLMPFDNNYLLAWNDNATLNLAEVSPEGKVVRRMMRPMSYSYSRTIVAWNGEHMLQINTQVLGGPATGYILDRTANEIVGPISLQSARSYSVATAGSDFVVASAGDSGAFLERISSAGVPKGRTTLDATSSFLPSVTVASHGESVAVVWSLLQGSQSFGLQSAIVSSAGVVTHHAPLPFPNERLFAPQQLFWTSSGYLLLLNIRGTSGDPKAFSFAAKMRLDESGVALEEATAISDSSKLQGVMSSAANGAMIYALASTLVDYSHVFLTDYSTSVSSIVLVDGSPARNETLSIMPTRHISPAIASDGLQFLSVWIDATTTTRSLRGRFLRSDGQPSSNDFEIFKLDGFLGAPAIAFGSRMYLVAFQAGVDLVALRIAPNGVLVDPTPRTIAKIKSTAEPAIAWNGTDFLVAWTEYWAYLGRVLGSVVTLDGGTSAPQVLSVDPANVPFSDSHPQLAWDGHHYLLVWNSTLYPLCYQPPCGFPGEVRAVRLEKSGQLTDSKSVKVVDRGSIWDNIEQNPTGLASNGRGFLITVDHPSQFSAFLVDATGPTITVSSPIRIFNWWTTDLATSVAWDGRNYVVTWRYAADQEWFLGVTWVSDSGVPAELRGVSTSAAESVAPLQIASNTLGDSVIVMPEVRQEGSVASSARTFVYTPNETNVLPQPPRAPSIRDALTSPFSNIVVSWVDNSDDELGFIIERGYQVNATSPLQFAAVTRAPANTSEGRIDCCSSDTFRVRAWNAGGPSEPSAGIKSHPPRRHRSAGR